jgi:hypothetical protein
MSSVMKIILDSVSPTSDFKPGIRVTSSKFQVSNDYISHHNLKHCFINSSCSLCVNNDQLYVLNTQR